MGRAQIPDARVMCISTKTTTSMSRFFENDAFFLIFAGPALGVITGSMAGATPRLDGTGIAAYGLAYFLVHTSSFTSDSRFHTTENVYLMSARPTRCTTNTSARRTENALACSGCRGNTSLTPAKPCAPNANQAWDNVVRINGLYLAVNWGLAPLLLSLTKTSSFTSSGSTSSASTFRCCVLHCVGCHFHQNGNLGIQLRLLARTVHLGAAL